jgi:hypothetical protein
MGDFVVEHGESARARRLRRNRLKIALVVAAIEGIVVLAGGIPWWFVVILAVGAVAVYIAVRDRNRPELLQLAWIAAFSQLVLVLVPVIAGFLLVLAIVIVVAFALIALVALARDRR